MEEKKKWKWELFDSFEALKGKEKNKGILNELEVNKHIPEITKSINESVKNARKSKQQRKPKQEP